MRFYNLLLVLLSPILLALIMIDGYKRGGRLIFLKQKLGFGFDYLHENSICIHCASVGEFKAAEPLINAIKQPIVITTNTPTAANIIQNMQYKHVQCCYLPWDGIGSVKRFLFKIKPKQLWVMETEIWPNLYRLANKFNIPIYLLNARLSNKTLKIPEFLKRIYQETLLNVKLILTKNETESKNFESLGVCRKKIKTLGNLKYLFTPTIQSISKTNPIQREFILLASSHEQEEYNISQLWLKLNRKELLVIVPRHNQRSIKIQKQLSSLTSNLAVQSELSVIDENTDILLVDTMGQLMTYYKYSKVVIVGGSFVPKGGHNILEPASLSKPIITGCYMSDFIEETEMLKQAGGLIQVPNYESIAPKLICLLDDSKYAMEQGNNAKKVLQSQQHILQKYLIALKLT